MISSCSPGGQEFVTSIQYGFRSTGSTMGVSIASVPDELNNPTLIDSIKKNAVEKPSYAFEKAPRIFKNIIGDSLDKSCHVVFIFLIETGVLSMICICFTEENDICKRQNSL